MDEFEAANLSGDDMRDLAKDSEPSAKRKLSQAKKERGPAAMNSADLAGTGVAGVGVTGVGSSAGLGAGPGPGPTAAMSVDASSGFGFILDIPVTMSLEVGSTKVTINELLTMGDGAVIELNRSAGDPLDVKVNGKLIGRGEVVETNGRYGIRLTEIISQSERLGQIT